MAVKDFVLVEVYDRYTRLLEEYKEEMHPVLKQHNDVLKERYEMIVLKIEGEQTLNEVEANELYHILNETFYDNKANQTDCSKAFLQYCFPVLDDAVMERELKQNHKRYFHHLKDD